MSTETIRERLAQCKRLPEGRAKAQRLESLAAEAKEGADHRVEADVLLALSQAYEYGSERERMPVVFGRLLQLLDRFPEEAGPHSWTILWRLKWMTLGLIRNPAVPLETCYRWLDELGSRYRQRGYSLRPVHALRWMLAQDLGDAATASAEMEASIAAVRDRMTDCQACEQNDWGTWRAAQGDDTGALDFWRPVLDGKLQCQEEPHRVLAKALLPLVRSGRLDEGRGAFLRGYPLVRRNVNLRAGVGEHIEFCALTGNEARGLEILAEHAAWLGDAQTDAYPRLSFLGGVSVLLRRLTGLGHGSVPVGAVTADATLVAVEQEIRELCGRFDARHGNTAVSDRVAARLASEPLLDHLPLGSPARLPQRAAPAPASQPGTRSQSPPEIPPGHGAPAATVDELIDEARQLSQARHPRAIAAWEKVAASGADLPGDAAARIARARAGASLSADPGAAYQALQDAAGRFAALGDTGRALEARAVAALAQALAGDHSGAIDAAAGTVAEAQTAFADGKISARLYLATRLPKYEIAVLHLRSPGQRTQAAVAEATELAGSELALAQQLEDQHQMAIFQERLGQLSSLRDEPDVVIARLTTAAQLFIEAGEPWHAAAPKGFLAQLACQRRDPQAAEELAREALGHGTELPEPELMAQVGSILAEAIGAQPGRDLEFVDASLAAAARWEGISAPDTVHNTANAARAYSRLGRHGEAAALFAEVMPRLHISYQPDVIAVTRGQYGTSLHHLGRHRQAAEELLTAATLVQEDGGNVAVHARLARAAADELQHSGQMAEAVAAYQRAAALFGELGKVVERVHSLRSAAWVQFGEAPEAPAGPADEQAGVTSMRAVLGELESLTESSPSEELTAELASTREQLDAMLTSDRGVG